MFRKIIKSIIVFTIITVPLFYLPFTQEQFQFNKEMCFLILMLIAGVLWFGKAILEKRLEIIRTPLDVPILLVVLVYGLATAGSIDWLNSLINLNGSGLPSFITIISLALFYFICVNVFLDAKSAESMQNLSSRYFKGGSSKINLLLYAVLISSFLAQLIFYFSFLGIRFLPSQNANFNTLGSFAGLASFIALTIPLGLYFLFKHEPGKKRANLTSSILSIVYLVFTFLTLNTINFNIGWWITAIGSFVFLVLFTTYHVQLPAKIGLAWVGALILALSLIFIVERPASLLFFVLPDGKKPQIPAEVSLSRQISRKLAFSSSVADPLTFLAGRGPGNFVYVFSKERPEQFNQNALWQVRFNQANNFFYEAIATLGWLGFISFLLLFIFFIATMGFLLMKIKDDKEKSGHTFLLITLITIFVSTVCCFWLSVPKISIWLLLWVIFVLAGVVGILSSPNQFEKVKINFQGSTRNALFLSFGLVFVFVLLLFFLIFIGRLYLGEYYYKQSRQVLNQEDVNQELIEKSRSYINRAIDLNQKRADYYLTNAQLALAQVQLEMQDKQPEEVDTAKVQQLLAGAINQSKIAVDLKPNSVNMWENRGVIFESVTPFTQSARVHAVQSFKKACDLEPTNPVLYYRLGENQRLLSREREGEKEVEGILSSLELQEQAIKNLEKAVKLRPSYLAAHISLARIYESKEDLAGAVSQLKQALSFAANQNQAGAFYDLSRLMYNKILKDQEDLSSDKAIETLREILVYLDRAIELSPNFSNALYTRSLIQKQLGNLDQALEDMEQVVKLNPDSQEAQSRLNQIKAALKPKGPVEPIEVPEELEE